MFKRLKEQIEAGSHEQLEKSSKAANVESFHQLSDETITNNEKVAVVEELVSCNSSIKSRTTSVGDDSASQFDIEKMDDCSPETKSTLDLQKENEALRNEMKELRNEFNDVNKLRMERDKISKHNSELQKIIDGLKRSLENEMKQKEEIKKELDLFRAHRDRGSRKESESDDLVTAAALKERVSKLEEELNDKTKLLRLQNQKMRDMKKSLENGDLIPFRKKGVDIHSANSNSDLYDSSSTDNSPRLPRKVKDDNASNNVSCLPSNATVFNEISFQYLKNLVYKFVTSSECEAQQLTKALSVLLKFSAEEERSIRDTLDWRMSWYKNLPILGSGLKPAPFNK